MNEDRITGQRAGIRWAIAWLRGYADNSDGSFLRNALRTAASDMLAAAKAMRADELPSEGWQDIATAPRDGTLILATGGGLLNDVEIVNYNERVGCWCAENITLDDTDYEPEGYNRPTHWMPLPPPSDTDDITAGLEALKEPIVAEWGEVKDRLNLGKDTPK